MNKDKMKIYSLHDADYGIVNLENCKRIIVSSEEKNAFEHLMSGESNSFSDNEKRILQKLIEKGFFSKKAINREIENVTEQRQTVHFYLTDYCNYYCKYCYADAAPKKISNQTLSLQDGKKIINRIVDCGFKEVVFTGGEPFLYKDLFPLAAYARRKLLRVGLLTNGYYIDEETAKRCRCFHYVKTSLDGSQAQYHDPMRGEGSFTKTVEAIRLLKNNNVNVEVGSVITKVNMENIPDLLTFVSEDLHIDRHTLSQYTSGKRKILAEMECNCDEIIEINYKTLKYKLSKRNKETTSGLEYLLPTSPVFHCGMGVTEILVDYLGDVYPCRMSRYKKFCMGNMLCTDLGIILEQFLLSDIYNSADVDKQSACKICNYKYLCGGGCRMHHAGYSGALNEVDASVCKIMKNEIDDKLKWKQFYTIN